MPLLITIRYYCNYGIRYHQPAYDVVRYKYANIDTLEYIVDIVNVKVLC